MIRRKRKKKFFKKTKQAEGKPEEKKDEETWEAGYGNENDDVNEEESKMIRKKKKELEATLGRMNDVLQRIENANNGVEETGDLGIDMSQINNPGQQSASYENINYYSNVEGMHYIPPDQNNLPLFMK